MDNYIEKIMEIINKNKKKLIITTSICVFSVVGLGLAGATLTYNKAKSNINYTTEQVKEIALGAVKGDVVGIRKKIELDTCSFEYEVKIKDENNILREVTVDTNLGVITTSAATVADWVFNDTELTTGIVSKFEISGTCWVETEFTVVTDWVTGVIPANTEASEVLITLFIVPVVGVTAVNALTVAVFIESITVVLVNLTLAIADVEVLVTLVTNGAVVIVIGLTTAFTVEVVRLWRALIVFAATEDNTATLLEVIVFTKFWLVTLKVEPTLVLDITNPLNTFMLEVELAPTREVVVAPILVTTSIAFAPAILWT